MQAFIRSLSDRTEFLIVVLGAFGYSMLGSLISLVVPSGKPHISNSHLQFLIVYELLVITVLWSLLHVRGWSLVRIGLRPGIQGTFIGIGLAIATYLVHVLIWIVAISLSPHIEQIARDTRLVAPGLTIGTVIVVSLINPVFEELFVTGYVITYLKDRRGLWFAINISVLIRLVYHLYQGTVGVISIIPIGFIFAYWYARTGRLWPLIVAHATFDLLALLASMAR